MKTASRNLYPQVEEVSLHREVLGADHGPTIMTLNHFSED